MGFDTAKLILSLWSVELKYPDKNIVQDNIENMKWRCAHLACKNNFIESGFVVACGATLVHKVPLNGLFAEAVTINEIFTGIQYYFCIFIFSIITEFLPFIFNFIQFLPF